MKVGRNGVETTTDPLSVSAFIGPYVRLKRLMDVGAIDAENFYISGNHFSSAYIQAVADMPTKSKYFQGQFFDGNASSEGENFLSNHLEMIGKIGDEEIIYTVDVDVVHKESETSYKTSEARKEWKKFKGSSRNFFADANFFGARSKAGNRAKNKQRSLKKRAAIAKEWDRQSFEKNIITIPVPEGYRFIEVSHYGAIFARISGKRVKVSVIPVSKTVNNMMFEVSLLFDSQLAADEAYSYNGKLSVKFARKV